VETTLETAGEQSPASPDSPPTPDSVEAAPEPPGKDDDKAPAVKQKEATADTETPVKKEADKPVRKPRARKPKKPEAVETKPGETLAPPAQEADADMAVTNTAGTAKTARKPRRTAKPKVEIPIESPVEQKPAAASDTAKTNVVDVDKEADGKVSEEPTRKGWWSLS
jgi:hypothetical protein